MITDEQIDAAAETYLRLSPRLVLVNHRVQFVVSDDILDRYPHATFRDYLASCYGIALPPPTEASQRDTQIAAANMYVYGNPVGPPPTVNYALHVSN